MTYRVKVIKSRRRTLSLEIKNGEVIARVPVNCSKIALQQFLDSHSRWIEKHLVKSQLAKEAANQEGILSTEELNRLYLLAKKDIPLRVAYYAQRIGVDYARITIRCQKTRWGSCSSKGNLNFNCLLELCPEPVRDSVVVHELCHRKYMNHSQAFYAEILKVFPDYYKWNKWLKDNGSRIICRAGR